MPVPSRPWGSWADVQGSCSPQCLLVAAVAPKPGCYSVSPVLVILTLIVIYIAPIIFDFEEL